MRASVVDVGSKEWLGILARVPHDFYQLPSYVGVSARYDGGEAAALYVEDAGRELLLPLVIRPIDGADLVDATSPYGYPGLLTTSDDRGFESEALLAGLEQLRDRRVVSLFIRLHPLLNPDPAPGVGALVQHGNTVTIDVSLPCDTLWSQTRRNHRQQIRQAQEAGYVALVEPGHERFSEFRRLYVATMESVSASSYYYFDETYFDGLRTALGESLRIGVVELADSVAAAALFVETTGIVQMHLTGADAEHARYQPMKLLFDHIRTWSHDRGCHWLHLGGGRGGADDSLYHFKAGFSPLRQPFYTRRIVVQPERYEALVAASGQDADPTDASGHFPLYRR